MIVHLGFFALGSILRFSDLPSGEEITKIETRTNGFYRAFSLLSKEKQSSSAL